MLKRNKCFYLLIFFLHLAGHNLYPQAFDATTYTAENGLAQDYIYSVKQDINGYLWIGTGDGLSRFDGQKFKNFTTLDGLSENFVKTLFIDKSGRVWVGHYEGGVSVYENYTFKKLIKSDDISSPVNAITQDENGTIWIGTQSDGLLKVKNNKLESFNKSEQFNGISSLVSNEDGSILIGSEKGLFRFSSDKRVAIHTISTQPIKSIIRMDNKKGYWILCNEGLHQIKVAVNLKLESIILPAPIFGVNMTSLFEDASSALLLGTEDKGVFKIKVKNGEAVLIHHIERETGLKNPQIKSILVDRENNVWTGTYGGGLTKLTELEFRIFEINRENSDITALTKTNNNYLWAGSEEELKVMDLNYFSGNPGSDTETFKTNPEIGKITSLVEAPNKDILIGTEVNGVFAFNPFTNVFTKYFRQEHNPSANRIKDLVFDNNGNCWIGTFDGIYKTDSTSQILSHYTIADGLLHNVINGFYIDSKKNVWIITQGSGLSKFVNDKFITFKLPDQINTHINCITEDKTGKIWIGTNGAGIFSLSRNRLWKIIDKNNGLGSNYCYSITSDINNNLWVTHAKGVTKFNPGIKKAEYIKEVKNIPFDNLNQNTSVKDELGNIWFACGRYLVKYLPEAEINSVIRPSLIIKDIDLFFADVNWEGYSDSLFGESKLPYHLDLKYNDNHLNFHFGAITMQSPEKIQYVYILDEFDQKWSIPTTQTYATYAKLPPGSYEFKVAALTGKGGFSKPATFSFTVRKPFWKTWWFLSLILIIGFVSTGGVIFIRIKNLQEKQLFLQKQQEALLVEINERKIAERELLKSEEKLKVFNQKLEKTNKELSTFVYRSSHDLKGPLMSIMGLSVLGKMESKDDLSVDYFNKISKTTHRLDCILKDLMQVTEIKDWELKIEPIDFNKLVNEVLNSIDAANDLSIATVRINCEAPFFSDYVLIFKGMKVVVENAFRYLKKQNTQSNILISIETYSDGVKIEVEDNGIGISEAVIGKVFDMFFKGTESSSGFGLGLYLLSNCVEKLNGSCSLSSKEGQYTIMTILLPNLTS